MQIQRYLALQGVCSRREAEKFLKAGLVTINGRVATPGTQAEEGDVVALLPAAQKTMERKMTVAIYKPRGIVCSYDKTEGKTVFEEFPEFRHLNTVGRLDKESEGLLLLSNDGLITKRVTGIERDIEKEYEVGTQETLPPAKLRPMERGVHLDDGVTLPAKVAIVNRNLFRIILREGRNRQIRRMCDTLRLTVVSLKRIRIGTILLGDMVPGDSRKLSTAEFKSLGK